MSVPRLHLVELHDLEACPRLLRQTLTELLQKAVRWTRVYAPAVPLLAELLERAGEARVVDLCSGSGGPWADLQPQLAAALGRPVEVTLTDLYPDTESLSGHEAASAGALRFCADSVDATRVPAPLQGVRTLFTSFHHFRPAVAREILADAARRGVPIAVFEANERSALACLGMLLSVVPAVWAWTPGLRPLRWSRLLWTYALPVFPVVMLWDGLVSNLRAYSAEELRALTDEIDAPGYAWEIGELPRNRLGIKVTYLLGAPTSAP